MPAPQQWAKTRAAPQVQNANPFRRVQFVAGKRKHIDLAVRQVDGNLADSLDRIRMKHSPYRTRHGRHFLDREQGACFIIGPHHAHQCDIVTQ